jgi:DNA-binding NarL/FixJ family response regulator
MPEMNGLEVAARVVEDYPSVRVIMLSMHTSEEYVWQAFKAGATGYLLKSCDAAELEQAIRAVLAGEKFLTPAVSQQSVDNYMQRLGNANDVTDVLTRRQREVLQLIAEGHSVKAIAAKLHIGAKTVETHRAMLMDRLEIHDTPSLVRYAIRMGLVSPES